LLRCHFRKRTTSLARQALKKTRLSTLFCISTRKNPRYVADTGTDDAGDLVAASTCDVAALLCSTAAHLVTRWADSCPRPRCRACLVAASVLSGHACLYRPPSRLDLVLGTRRRASDAGRAHRLNDCLCLAPNMPVTVIRRFSRGCYRVHALTASKATTASYAGDAVWRAVPPRHTFMPNLGRRTWLCTRYYIEHLLPGRIHSSVVPSAGFSTSY